MVDRNENPFKPKLVSSPLRLVLDARSFYETSGELREQAEFLCELCNSPVVEGLWSWDGNPIGDEMSKENVEVVRRSYVALLQGDWDQVAQLHDPDVELHGTVGGPSEGSVRRGVQQITQAFQQENAEASDDTRLVMERFIDAGDRVLMLLDDFGPGKGSDVEADMAVIFELRNGRVVRIQGYMDRASAFKAAGLSEAGS